MSSRNLGNDRAWCQRLLDNPGLVIAGEPRTSSRLRDPFQPVGRHVRLKRMVKHRHKPIPSKRSSTSSMSRATRRWAQNDAYASARVRIADSNLSRADDVLGPSPAYQAPTAIRTIMARSEVLAISA